MAQTAPVIAVIGGGYAGIAAIGGLAGRGRPPAELHLFDPSPGHQLMPELPSALDPGDDVARHVLPFPKLLGHRSVQWHRVRVAQVNAAQHTLTDESGTRHAFDWAVVAVGTTTFWPPVPGLAAHALPFRTATDAEAVKAALKSRRRLVVGGGGLTGVELAGELAPRYHVVLVEAAPRLLPGLGLGLARYAAERLERAGVRVMAGQRIRAVTDPDILLDGGGRIPYDTLIWAGGVAAPAGPELPGVAHDEHGYPRADAWGQVAPGVFVAGDLWIHRSARGGIWPQTAQSATADGKFAAQTIWSRVERRQPGPAFEPTNHGILVSLDPSKGVGWVVDEGIPVWGFGARVMKNLAFKRYRQQVAHAFGRRRP